MKLKIGIIDSDITYVKRFMSNVQRRLSDDMELYVYTSMEEAHLGLKKVYLDVLLVAEEIQFDRHAIPGGIVLICFTKKDNVEEIDGIPAISKYHQKLTEIYKNILNIYAEKSVIEVNKKRMQNANFHLFISVQGGVGVTTTAASYAVNLAQKGKQVFFLSLDTFGDISLYFSGEGKQSFTDILNALKKDINIEAKFKSVVKVDSSNVEFLDVCKNAYDMVELKDSELEALIEAILTFEKPYDEIVIEYSGNMDKRMLLLMKKYANTIIYVNDGTSIGNCKFQRFCEAIKVIEYKEETHLLNKMRLLYNKFSSKTSQQLSETAIPVIGGIHRFVGLSEKEIIHKMADLPELRWD
ncbi:MAG: AAA family ATPase [Clostridiales bacterium]|nr:AAA family ATPase [Clostridiales bacterium]